MKIYRTKILSGFLKYTIFFHFEDTACKKTPISKFRGHEMSADRVRKTPLFLEI